MSRRPVRSRPRTPGSRASRAVLAVAATVAGVGALSGCGAGFHPQTTPSMQPPNAANYPLIGYTSPIAIRNAFVLAPADPGSLPPGGNAAVYLSLINQTRHGDRLLSVSSTAADTVTVRGGGKSGGGTGTGTGTGTGKGIAIPAGDPASDTSDPIQVGRPPYGEDTITLTGLTDTLTGTSTVPLELNFERAGTIEMNVPVAVQSDDTASLSPAPSVLPSSGPSDAPGPSSGPSGSESSPAPSAS